MATSSSGRKRRANAASTAASTASSTASSSTSSSTAFNSTSLEPSHDHKIEHIDLPVQESNTTDADVSLYSIPPPVPASPNSYMPSNYLPSPDNYVHQSSNISNNYLPPSPKYSPPSPDQPPPVKPAMDDWSAYYPAGTNPQHYPTTTNSQHYPTQHYPTTTNSHHHYPAGTNSQHKTTTNSTKYQPKGPPSYRSRQRSRSPPIRSRSRSRSRSPRRRSRSPAHRAPERPRTFYNNNNNNNNRPHGGGRERIFEIKIPVWKVSEDIWHEHGYHPPIAFSDATAYWDRFYKKEAESQKRRKDTIH